MLDPKVSSSAIFGKNREEGLLSLGDLLGTADGAAGVGLMVSFVHFCVSRTYQVYGCFSNLRDLSFVAFDAPYTAR